MVAALEALAIQRQNQRSEDDKTYHFLFSFQNGEYPQSEVLLDCERELCRALGFAEHQRVSVVHHDTDNVHVHVAINKIHPTRLTIHTPFNDYWVRDRAAERLEIKHNLKRDPHGHRDPAQGPSGRAADMERHSGIESFLGWVQRQAGEELCRAASWDALHRAASAHGLAVQLRGNGCVITQGAHAVRASSVRRELSLHALQKRLGPFEAAAREQGALVAAAPPAHLRGNMQSLHAVQTLDARLEQGLVRPSLEELRQRSDDWSRLIEDLSRAERAKEQTRPQRGRGEARQQRDQTPPAHIRGGLGSPSAMQTLNAHLDQGGVRPSLEELQQRSDEWSRLIEELSHAARNKLWLRLQSARVEIAARRQSYAKRPLNADTASSDLYKLYLRDRAREEAHRQERRAKLRLSHQSDFARVIKRWRLRRAVLRLASGTRAEKRFMYAAARALMQQELNALRASAKKSRQKLAQTTKRLTWSDWLQTRARSGNAEALDALRGRSGATQAGQGQRLITGMGPSAHAQAPHGIVDTITKTGNVIYRGALTGVRDDGNRLRVQGSVSRPVLAAALRVAAIRYGAALRIEGDDAFKQAVVDVVIERSMAVTFEDPHLEARRRAQQPLENDDGRRLRSKRDVTGRQRHESTKQSRQAHSEAAAQQPATSQRDGVRDVRVGELVRDGKEPQRVLPPHVLAHVARGARQDSQALRRAAGAARQVTTEPPLFRRGRLRSLSTLGALQSEMQAEPQRHSSAAAKRAHGRADVPQRPMAPRSEIPALDSMAAADRVAKPKEAMRVRTPSGSAVERYVAEREAKRARGIADILPHTPFDGRRGEFTVLGRRTVDGQALLLLSDKTKVVVLPALPDAEALRSGDRVTLNEEGRIVGRSQGRRR